MSRLLEAFVPARLGVGFRLRLVSTWLACAGDGMALAAGPLLVASMTHRPFLIAMGAFVQWVPQFLFALVAGVVTDRVDRQVLLVGTELARAAVVAVLAVSLFLGWGSIALVLAVLFALATLEVFSNSVGSTITPMIVAREDLPLATARMQVGYVTINQLIGPPLGAFLFGAGQAWPFVGQAVLVAFAALLVVRIALPKPEARPEQHWLRDVREGVVYAVRHDAVRTLVLTILVFNVTWGAAWSVLVLYTTERLGLSSFGFGLLNAVIAVGGVVANVLYTRITRRIGMGNLMRIGLVIETAVHGVLALTTSPWIAGVVMFAFGFEAFAWGTTSISVRQQTVPTELQGRVNAVNSLGMFGGLVIGSALGGLIAQHWGVTAPFWFAFGGSAVFLVVMWRSLSHVASAPSAPHPAPAP